VSRSCEPKAWQGAKQSSIRGYGNNRLPRRLRLLAMGILLKKSCWKFS
jgi:hypothetical protein